MTQKSAFHNGYQVGDAKYYDDTDFQEVMSLLHLGRGGYIVPSGSTNTLGVTHNAGQDIDVAAGSAFIAGIYYNNSAVLTLSLEDNATTYTRIDRVVIRVNWSSQTVRTVVIRGVADANPVVPDLTQIFGSTFEVALATIIIPPAFAAFGDNYILDERQYIVTPDEEYTTKNLMFNSEFLSLPSKTFAPNVPFPMWYSTNISSTIIYAVLPKFDEQSRGRKLDVRLNNVTPLDFYTYIYLNNGTTKRAAISFIIQVLYGEVEFSLDGGVTTTYTLRQTAEPIIVTARTLVGAGGGAQAITPHFSTPSTNARFYLGQVTVTIGSNAAPFLPQHEFIIQPFRSPVYEDYGNGTVTVPYDAVDVLGPTKNLFNMLIYLDGQSSLGDTSYCTLYNNVDVAYPMNFIRNENGRTTLNSAYTVRQGMVGADLAYGANSTYIYNQYIHTEDIFTSYWYLYTTGVDV